MPDHYDQRWVSRVFRKDPWAVTLGQHTFYSASIHSVGEEWKKHEDIHKQQYARHGFICFLVRYVIYHFRYGYKGNPFEREASGTC